MSEVEKPKRRFWQFHLRSAIVFVSLSGALMGLNFTDRMHHTVSNLDNDDETAATLTLIMNGTTNQFGWPLVANERYYRNSSTAPHPFSRWIKSAAWIDLVVAIGILTIAVIASEWLTLRREDRKL